MSTFIHHLANLIRFMLSNIRYKIIFVIGGDEMNSNYYEKYRKLGLNIAYYRKLNNYTQLQFSEILDIDRSHLSGIELGNNAPSLDLIFKICEKLNITESDLFTFR